MQKVTIAFLLGVILNIVIAKSTTNKDLFTNKKSESKQLNNNVSYKSQTKPNVTLHVQKLLTRTNNVNDAYGSKKAFYITPTTALYGGRHNNSINQHIENVRNKNNEMNFKMAQLKANPHNSNSTKLIERYLKLKVNTTNENKVPEVIAPAMIPIFRPMKHNVRSVPQPLASELIRADDLSNGNPINDLDSNQNGRRPVQNNEEVHTGEVYLENTKNNLFLNDLVNSTDRSNILSLEETLKILKEQQKGWYFQQIPLAYFEQNEMDDVSISPNHDTNSFQMQPHFIDVNQESLSQNGQEQTVVINNHFNNEHTFMIDQNVFDKQVLSPDQSDTDRYIQIGSPQLKMEFIPVNADQLNSLHNFQNTLAPPENMDSNNNGLNDVPNIEVNPNQNVDTQAILLKSMHFTPVTAINNNLHNTQTLPNNIIVQKQFNNEPSAKVENSEANLVLNILRANMSDQELVKGHHAASNSQVHQNNIAPPIGNGKISSIKTSTSFNIPCHRAADILEDFVPINQQQPFYQVQPILNSITENPIANLQCEKPLVMSQQDAVDDDSLAIVFKPKNISLLKFYGDLLKKITLTVLVPYHISKLTS